MYLTAVIDWFSRYGRSVAWPSNTLEGQLLEALDEALLMGRPERSSNTDQGSQFTVGLHQPLEGRGRIAVSRDGRGRALDNVFVERLWRSVRNTKTYHIKDYEQVHQS